MMDLDDPKKPEFASWRSFHEFARRVRHQRRYVWDEPVNAFLATVLATRKDRDVTLHEGMILFRAQMGIDHVAHEEDGPKEPTGYDSVRMKPRPNRSTEGRANPAGVSVLYLGTTAQTVISEVRPWVGAEVSVAQLKLLRDLKAIDLSQGFGQTSFGIVTIKHLLGEAPLDAERRERAVWIDIDNAFSEPVTKSDDAADYVPTQILTELFKDAGYEAIVYKSQFGEKGYNIVLFNPNDADVINCAPYQVTGLEVAFEEIGNRWFSTKHLEEKKAKRKKG